MSATDVLAAERADPVAALPAELSIVVPAFNEAANVGLLVEAVAAALPDIRWEMVFVDDNSPDGTSARVRELAAYDARVRIVQRYGRRGLSSACVEGILASAAPYVAVMDCDLQHDERALAAMFATIRSGDVDLVVGSRYVEGGSVGDWNSRRLAASRLATRMATMLTRTPISDPMSGFFMITRDAFERSLPRLSSVGFKILLDIAASAPAPLRIAEVPYTFRNRQHGESKLDSLVLWEYFQLILDKAFGRVIPVRFMSFALVGIFGLAVHFAILTFCYVALGTAFAVAQTAATVVAITNNFILNNLLTYRDQRLKGPALLRGWLTFNLVCATGAAANVGMADWLFERHTYWVFSAIAGVLVSVVWNYAMSSLFTWRQR
ncbi:glycosyltransferase family 2 protein [Sphingomonas endophytica]|uniref:Dolichol monophosphate mannose synthase n=1 Tax=Sphingomonas endophytica TaxID=869719 RepID=A0A147I4Y6_9SPHN|nr:glycosyltransferase family 2 protein [Sphingomonas endophytica]KTT73610.1 dolichol monophosphate mannose synthase [Sphingomonas endophytica]